MDTKNRKLSDTFVEEEVIKSAIERIVNRAGRLRRSTVHWILWDQGLIARPGKDWSSHSFQIVLDGLIKEGKIKASKTQRATYLSSAITAKQAFLNGGSQKTYKAEIGHPN